MKGLRVLLLSKPFTEEVYGRGLWKRFMEEVAEEVSYKFRLK